MIDSDFLALVDPLDDLSRHFIRELALSPAAPEHSSVDVLLVKGSRSRDTFPRHVTTCVAPRRVETRSVGSQSSIGEAMRLPKLSPGD